MEMVISSTAPVSTPQSAAGGSAQAADGQVFQQVLVQQMNGASGDTVAAVQQAVPVIVANPLLAGMVDVEQAVDLTALIEQLMTQLDEEQADVTSEESEEALAELQDMLDQMNALLALLGTPSHLLQQAPSTGLSGAEAGELSAQEQLTSVKGHLQDALFHLQSLLQQQGALKLVSHQEPTALVGQQLQALQQLLTDQANPAVKEASKQSLHQISQQSANHADNQAALLPQLLQEADWASRADNSNQSVKDTTTTIPMVKADVKSPDALLQRLTVQSVNPVMLKELSSRLEASSELEMPHEAFESQPTSSAFHLSMADAFKATTAEAVKAATQQSYILADQFAESMQGLIVQKFDIATLNGSSEAKIILFPEHLGQVDVKITMQNGQLTAVFQTDTPMAKEMLDNQMAQLRQSLQSQGLAVDKLEVTYGQSAQGLGQGQQGHRGNQQSTANRSKNNGSEAVAQVDGNFETELVEQAVNRGLGFGRGISVRA